MHISKPNENGVLEVGDRGEEERMAWHGKEVVKSDLRVPSPGTRATPPVVMTGARGITAG